MLLVAVLAGQAAAEAVTVTIDHTGEFRAGNAEPIIVSIDGRATRVAKGKVAAVQVEVGLGRIVPIDVRIPGVGARDVRHMALVPHATYRLVANPCSFWVLDTDASGDEATFTVDASTLPADRFPLEVNGVALAAPGVSPAFALDASAMCLRAGERVVIRHGKQVLFERILLGHPGRSHTITLRVRGGSIAGSVSIDPLRETGR